MDPTRAETALRVLQAREPYPTDVDLVSGASFRVFNVAWGKDSGSEYHHVTANCSPAVPDHQIHFFLTSEIVALRDPESGEVVWTRSAE